DRLFINHELKQAARPHFPDERFLCTLIMARSRFPGVRNSLDSLCDRFRISLASREKHGALIDAHLLAEVYLELNGGRERRLDLSVSDAGAAAARQGAAKPRPAALPDLITANERAAHTAFIESLGGGKPL